MNKNSIWLSSCQKPSYPKLEGDLKTDVLVLGGGISGLLCAYLLKQKGVECTVIEQNEICSGATAFSTAKITAQHGAIYQTLIEKFGTFKAETYLHANIDAAQKYRDIILKENIDCDYSYAHSVVYTLTDMRKIENEFMALTRLGLSAEIIKPSELPFDTLSALKIPYGAMFNPYKFCIAISKGLNIYENTPALKVNANTVETPGGKITANKIIIATHYPIKDLPGAFFLRMSQSRTYMLAMRQSKPLKNMYIDEHDGGLTLRQHGARTIIGGMGHRTGEGDGERFENLAAKARALYPHGQIEYMWSNQDCMSVDSLPYIGTYSKTQPDIFVATGYGKWGITNSMAAATIISDAITNQPNEYASLFSPQRLTPAASSKKFLINSKKFITAYSKNFAKADKSKITELQNGSAIITKIDGVKKAVYRDNSGEFHFASPKCSHLGGQLVFNADEKSWDCPCHGSRFDVDGNVISNPACKGAQIEV